MCTSVYIYIFICWPSGKLDDEIAASLYNNRLDMLDMDSIIQLTADNFHATVAQSSLTVALFYLKCKTRCPHCPVNEGKQMSVN